MSKFKTLSKIFVVAAILLFASSAHAEFDSYTKLVSHFNGSNGQTTYTAETGQSFTFVGTAQLSTAQKEFGTSSLLLDGDSDYVTVPDSADWNYVDGSYTIDLWARLNAFATNLSYALYNQRDDASNLIDAYLWNDGGTPKIVWRTRSGGNLDITVTSSGISANTWYHFAFVRQGNNDWRIYQNGVQQGATDTTAKTSPNLSAAVSIGEIAGGALFNGYIDEFRISKGIARWTENFTPPTAEYSSGYSHKVNGITPTKVSSFTPAKVNGI